MILRCWLKQFSEQPCGGRLDRAHLIARQNLKREGHRDACEDPRSWMPACRFHHGQFDNYRLTVPRSSVPVGTEELAEELGLGWWLDRRYGPQKQALDILSAEA